MERKGYFTNLVLDELIQTCLSKIIVKVCFRPLSTGYKLLQYSMQINNQNKNKFGLKFVISKLVGDSIISHLHYTNYAVIRD